MNEYSVKCIVLTMNYLLVHGRNLNSGPFDNSDLFPFGWYTELSDESRCKILSEAIDKKITIWKTSLYNDIVSDIKDVRK